MVNRKFEILKDYLNIDFESYIREWFPNAKRFGSNWCTGDFNDNPPSNPHKQGSLVIDSRRKIATDFNKDEKAGDIIAIYARRFCNGDNKKAFGEIVERYNLKHLFSSNNNTNNNNTNTNNNYNNTNNNFNINKLNNSSNNNTLNTNNYNNSNSSLFIRPSAKCLFY
jgi:hypothetical protein